MSIFGEEDAQLTRERALAQVAINVPTGFTENVATSWEAFKHNDATGALRSNRMKAWDDRIKAVEKLTGKKLESPYSQTPDFFRGAGDRVDPDNMTPSQRFAYDYIPNIKNPVELLYGLFESTNGMTEPQRLRSHEEEINRIRESLPPDQRSMIPTRDELEKQLQDRARFLEERNADVSSRGGIPGVLGQVVGTGGASITQPEILITMPLGASARAGLLLRVMTEAGIAAVTEAALQPEIQLQRKQLGLEYGFEQAAENVAGAAVGAAGLTTGVAVLGKAFKLIARGGADAFERMAGRPATPDERALIHAVQRDMAVDEVVPAGRRAAADYAVNKQNETVGYQAAIDARAIDDTDLVPTRPALEQADRVTHSQVEILGGDDIQKIGVDAKLMQFKAGADSLGVTDRLKGVNKWEVDRAGISLIYEFENGQRIIADGHQRLALAKRLAGQGQDVELPAMIMRQIDGITPEEARARAAFKNIAEGTGTAADAAKVLRDLGATIDDMALPPKSALVRDAEGLSRLDDVTFGMVINDVISEQWGAIIGRQVDDPRMQPEIAKLLAKLKPANAAEAESIVAQAKAAGVSRGTQTSLFGDEDIAESLFLERARIQDRAMKLIKRDIDTFTTLEQRGADITAEGNVLNPGANARRLEVEQQLKAYIQAQANRKGTIGDALTKAAREAKETGRYDKPAREFVDSVSRAIRDGEINGDSLSRYRADQGLERAAGPDPARARAEQRAAAGPTDAETLNKYSDPVSDATEKQALDISSEIQDEVANGAKAPEIARKPKPKAKPKTKQLGQFETGAPVVKINKAEIVFDDPLQAELYRLGQKIADRIGLEPDVNKPVLLEDGPFNLGPLEKEARALFKEIGPYLTRSEEYNGRDFDQFVNFALGVVADAKDMASSGRGKRTIGSFIEEDMIYEWARKRSEVTELAKVRAAEAEVSAAKAAAPEPNNAPPARPAATQPTRVSQADIAEAGLADDSLLEMEVPIGERIDADGNRVAETQSLRQILDDLQADQEFVEQLKLCDRGGA